VTMMIEEQSRSSRTALGVCCRTISDIAPFMTFHNSVLSYQTACNAANFAMTVKYLREVCCYSELVWAHASHLHGKLRPLAKLV
jgi:hypothetical protein